MCVFEGGVNVKAWRGQCKDVLFNLVIATQLRNEFVWRHRQ